MIMSTKFLRIITSPDSRLYFFVKVSQIASVNINNTNIRVTVTVFSPTGFLITQSIVNCGSLSMSDIAVASRSQNDHKNQSLLKFHMTPIANCTQRRQEVSHNSLGTSYCRIPAKRTGISHKRSALIKGRNRVDREVLACFARGGTGRYETLKVNKRIVLKMNVFINFLLTCIHDCSLCMVYVRAWNSSRKRGFLRKWKSKNKMTSILFFFFLTVRWCSRKYENHAVNECEFASKVNRWWSYRLCSFAYFKLFPWWKAGPDWYKKLVKPMNIDFAFEA